jgi:tRNA-splicing ligase RtcB
VVKYVYLTEFKGTDVGHQILNGDIILFGDADENTLKQALNCRRFFDHVALMGDNHLGYSVPIGGVMTSRTHISPAAVGYDICCGVTAYRLSVTEPDIAEELPRIMETIWRSLSFGMGRENHETVDDPLFDSPIWSEPLGVRLRDLARNQLGTIGSGNHFVDVMADEENQIWVACHFGSRGLGHKIAEEFLARAGAKEDNINADPVLLELGTADAEEYIAWMELAGQYAYAGRRWVCNRASEIVGGDIVMRVENHHNFASLEPLPDGSGSHWVMRKGATPASPGKICFIGGSMGDDSVIVEGVQSEDSAASFHSAPHGAGRAMSRNQARGKINRKTGKVISKGLVSRQDMDEWLRNKGVILRGGDTDEAPQAYKRLEKVLAYHSNLKVLHRLRPLCVAMAGREISLRDPYKD